MWTVKDLHSNEQHPGGSGMRKGYTRDMESILPSPSEKGPTPNPYPLQTRLDSNYIYLEECTVDWAVVFTGSAIDAALLVDFVYSGAIIKIDPVLLAEVGARSAFTTFICINAHFDHIHTSIYPIVKYCATFCL